MNRSNSPIAPLALAVAALGAASGLYAQEQVTQDELATARQLFAATRLLEARAELAAVLADRPEHPAANLLKARVELGLGDLDAAERHLSLSRAGVDRDRFMAPQTEGLIRMYRRDYAGAVESYSEALERAPRYGGALVGRAQAHAFLGDLQEAFADLTVAGESPQPQPAAELLRGELLLVLGRLPDAMQVFAALAEAPAEEAGVAGENARLYVDSFTGEPDSTEERARRWVERYPNRAAAHFWHGMVKLSRGETEQAARRFHVALSVDELHAPSYLAFRAAVAPEVFSVEELVGAPFSAAEYTMSSLRLLVEAGQLDQAEAGLFEVTERRPLFVPAFTLLVEIRESRGDAVGVLQSTADLAFVAPEMPALRARRATLARDLGALELAESEARTAVALSPSDGSLRYLLATVLAADARPAEAVAACEQALALSYDSAAMQITLGNAYRELQRIPEAVEALERAVQLDPSSAEYVAVFALNAIGGADADRLASLLEPWVRENPEAVNSRYALGVLYQRTGRMEEAIETLEEVLAQGRADKDVHYNLALAYRRVGNAEAAARHTERFQELQREEAARFDRGNAAFRLRTEIESALEAGEPERALSLLDDLVGAGTIDSGDMALRAHALAASGRPAEALASWESYLQERPADAEALCRAAALAAALERGERAAWLVSRAAALGRDCTATTE